MAKIYSFADIRTRVSCEEYLASQGIKLKNGRCAALWRGGDNPTSVHVDGDKWFDHRAEEGGSVIDLCSKIEANGSAQRAAQILGERYNIEPCVVTKRFGGFRSKQLMSDGYKETAVYDYTDEDGELVYQVVRFEKEGCRKEFVHRDRDGKEKLSGSRRMLYNLQAVIKADKVYVVEGEKDVETLKRIGLVATTNSGGASAWVPENNKYFSGKDVTIIADNDEAGEKHATLVSIALKNIAKNIIIIKPSKIEKGDITDWIEKEGGTIAKLHDLENESASKENNMSDKDIAAELNKTPFTNYSEVEVNKSRKIVPLSMNSILDDLHSRFMGFPALLGDVLFDYDHDMKIITYIHNKDSLFGWIRRVGKTSVVWSNKAEGCVSGGELFETLHHVSKRYSMIANVPTYPMRKDVFYIPVQMPKSDPLHSSFWDMINFFCPADETYKLILAALFIAPLYYEPSSPRPIWIIDTIDAQASGKTTVVKMLAWLYGDDFLPVDNNEVNSGIDKLTRMLLTSSARSKRIVLFDNITGTLKGKNLALLCTLNVLSGMAPYGRTAEIRPNDLTYVATVNGASVDTDIATRSYTVKIRKPSHYSPTWEKDVRTFIGENRLQIFSDMIDMINTCKIKSRRNDSRFEAFDSVVLASVCANEDEFAKVDSVITSDACASNEERSSANDFEEMFVKEAYMSDAKVDVTMPVFVRTSDIDALLIRNSSQFKDWTSRKVRKMIKQNLLPRFSKNIDRLQVASYLLGKPKGFFYWPDITVVKTKLQILKTEYGKFVLEQTVDFERNIYHI